MNKSNPHACSGITNQLNSVDVPLADLLTSLEEKQKKLAKVEEVLNKYEKEKQPFEEFINASSVDLEEMEPFGLDVKEGEEQSAKLDVSQFIYLFATLCIDFILIL